MKSVLKTMMLFVFVLLFLSGCIPAKVMTKEQEQSLQRIKDFSGLDKTELFKRTNNWIARNYNSANDVIQLSDPEAGQIICRGISGGTFDLGFTRYVSYTMVIDIKDERMRLSFENLLSIEHRGVNGPDMNRQYSGVVRIFDELSSRIFDEIVNPSRDTDW